MQLNPRLVGSLFVARRKIRERSESGSHLREQSKHIANSDRSSSFFSVFSTFVSIVKEKKEELLSEFICSPVFPVAAVLSRCAREPWLRATKREPIKNGFSYRRPLLRNFLWAFE